MANKLHYWYNLILVFALLSISFLSGCSNKSTFTSTASINTIVSISSTPTLVPTLPATPTLRIPTSTPEPLAVNVNGEGITMVEYQSELGRYQAAVTAAGSTLPIEADQKKIVIDEMIDQMLLSQAARQAGYSFSDSDLQARIDQLASQLGGNPALVDWETKQGYTDEGFRQSLRRSIEATWQRDQILAAVPLTADQVHVRQIIVYNQKDADLVITRLKSGVDFATLAWGYDQLTGGDLGWFPKGYLPIPEVETAAFSLAVGDYSSIIKSNIGFHIIQVIERVAQRPLSTDALQTLQRLALQKWVTDRRAQSQITILVP